MNRMLDWVSAHWSRSAFAAAILMALPVAGLLSPVPLALVWLRRGASAGLPALGAAAVIWLAAAWAGGMPPLQALLGPAALWLPVLVAAAVLRRSRSLSLALQAMTALAALVVLGFFWSYPDVPGFWLEMFKHKVMPLLEHAEDAAQLAAVRAALPDMARLATGMVAVLVAMLEGGTLLLARWVQAGIYSPGAFGREFRALDMGLAATLLGSVVFIAAAALNNLVLDNLALVMLGMFVFQGLAVVHGLSAGYRMRIIWLLPLYLLAVVLTAWIVALLAVLGLLDQWVDFRTRLRRVQQTD